MSLAGRAVLINSVLTAIPSYTMQSTLLPKGIINEIEKVNRISTRSKVRIVEKCISLLATLLSLIIKRVVLVLKTYINKIKLS